MATTKTSVRIPMAGLDQGTDPKVAQGLLLLENVRQERKGEFTKRNGMFPLAGSYADHNLAIYRGRPVLFGPSGVYSLSTDGVTLNKVDDAGFFDVDVIDLGTGGNASVVCVQVFEDTNILVVCYVSQNNVTGSPTYHLSTYDKNSLRLLATSSAVWKTRVFKQANTLIYVTQNPVDSKVSWGQIDVTTGAIATMVPCSGSTNTLFTGTFDCCGIGSTEAFGIVHTVDPSGAPELIVVDTFGTPNYTIGAVSVSTVHAAAIWPVSSTVFGIAYARTAGNDVEMSTWDLTATIVDSAIVAWGWSAADDICEDIGAIATSDTAGLLFMTLGDTQTTDTEDNSCRVITNAYTGAGSALAPVGATDPFQEGCRVVTKPFTDAAGAIYVVMQRQGSFLDGLNKCNFVINSSGQIVAHFLLDKATYNMSLKPGWLGAVTALASDSWRFGVAKLSGYETSHVAAVTLSKSTTGLRAVEAHGLLVLPGAHPWIFDGTNVVEMGFLHYPHAITAEPREAWDILNDIAIQYAAHLAMSIATHLNGPDGTNVLTATSPCTTQTEAILLANNIKAKLVLHAADTTHAHRTTSVITISAPDATDYDSLITLTDELVLEYAAHRILVGSPAKHEAADITNIVTETYDGTLDEATIGRGYQGIYEHYLATGQVERSAPSPVISVTNDALETMSIKFPELHHTVKTPVHFVLYRTEAQKAVLHRLQLQANDKTAYEGAMTDSAADATIDEEPSIYTTGNRLENLPPPPSRFMWVHQERLFAINREAEAEDVRYSMQFADGDGIAFNDILRVKCSPEGGRIMAGGSMLGRGILFKKSSIYTFYGDGLGGTGVGTGYSTPEKIASSIGCANAKTLIETPLGYMFLSEDGIYLLDRQWSVSAIGKPVKTHTDAITLSGAAHVKDRHCAIWTSSNGVTLVYDYLYDCWSDFTYPASNDVVVDENNRTWIKGTTTVVHYEDRTKWTDGNGEIDTAVRYLARSAWIAADEYAKVHAISIMGQARSDCTMRVKIAFDYQIASNGGPAWTYNTTLDIDALGYVETSSHYSAPGPGGTALDALLAKIRIARRCRSFLVEVTDETRSGQATMTKGFTLTGLDLLVTPKTGLFQPGSSRQLT